MRAFYNPQLGRLAELFLVWTAQHFQHNQVIFYENNNTCCLKPQILALHAHLNVLIQPAGVLQCLLHAWYVIKLLLQWHRATLIVITDNAI